MRRLGIAIALVSLTQAQQLPEVQLPRAVDVNVESVSWNPFTGKALTYVKTEAQGKGVGIYAVDQPEGKVVLRLGPDDWFEEHWFENQPVALLTVRRHFVQKGSPMIEASVYLADAATGGIDRLWTQTFLNVGGVIFDVECSPKLRHAIFTVRSGNQTLRLMMPSGGNRLVVAPDLDQAAKDGLSGPFWSKDGTAIYSKVESEGNRVGAKPRLKAFSAHMGSLRGSYFLPVPEVNAQVWELMPSSPVLRPVRFKGEWPNFSVKRNALDLLTKPVALPFGSSYSTNSLWLIRKENKTQGVLLTANAQQSWLAPQDTAVAYLTDGALIVRAFK